MSAQETTSTVWVAKADESRQCEKDSGVSLEKMASQLKGIPVISKQKKMDGKMHIQLCGSPTGMMNAYEIPVGYLEQAIKLGFKKFEAP